MSKAAIIARSVWVWLSVAILIALWLPLLAVIRLFDRDPVRYRTGRMFRRLGKAMTMANASWKVHVTGQDTVGGRMPFVAVSNHQSYADIPIISVLPWEMKWVGKEELFRIPFVGWMMRLASDISVRRGEPRSGARVLLEARRILGHRCPVMVFPEGTRSRDGRVRAFSDGPFLMAIAAQVPILPIAVEGSSQCLPKHSWLFGEPALVYLDVLPLVPTIGLRPSDAPSLRDEVRKRILAHVALRRGCSEAESDGLQSGGGVS